MKGVLQAVLFAGIAVILIRLDTMVGLLAIGVWLTLLLVGERRRARRAEALLRQALVSSEVLMAHGLQHRVHALFAPRRLVAITSRRIIVMARGPFGGFQLSDIDWRELKSVTVEEGALVSVFGADLRFTGEGEEMAIDGVDAKTVAAIVARVREEAALVAASPSSGSPVRAGLGHSGAMAGFNR